MLLITKRDDQSNLYFRPAFGNSTKPAINYIDFAESVLDTSAIINTTRES
ncbi:hypothetical protein [Aliagarivorans taiwanensis]|nr:hypothetical protein [Aliagarivorans taiwanensis]